MSVFDAIKRAVLRAEGTVIDGAFSSTEQVAAEMADLANEVAADIVEGHDWRALTKVAVITGTGAEAYSLPADYARMTLKAEVDDPATWFWGYEAFSDVNEWLRYKSGGFLVAGNGGWIILGDELQFYPGPTGNAQFPYISKEWARSEAGVAKSAFTADDDTFVLDERLLTLGLIWQWKAQKGLDYSEAMATYGTALSRAQSRDKGAYVTRCPRAVRGPFAYSGRAIT